MTTRTVFAILVLAANQLLDHVGLPMQVVMVIARLLREPEAEEVRGENGVLRLQVQQGPPVVRARGEAMQQEEERTAAAALEDMNAAAAELLVPPTLRPGLNA